MIPIVPSEAYTYEAIEAALDFALRVQHFDSRRVYLLGKSLGSGAATELARRCAARNVPLGGLFLQSAIASAVRVAVPTSYFTLPFVDIFVNCDKLADVQCKVVILHGRRDEVVPFWHAELLRDRVNPALLSDTYFIGA